MLLPVWHISNLKIVYIGKEDIFFLTILILIIGPACLSVDGAYYQQE